MVGERRVTRRVGKGGRASLANHSYHVGRWLAGVTVDVVVATDGLVEISHLGVLVATHAVRHPPEAEPQAWRRQPRTRPVKPPTVGQPVVRKVDSSGNISFAAVTYRVGNAHRREQVEVRSSSIRPRTGYTRSKLSSSRLSVDAGAAGSKELPGGSVQGLALGWITGVKPCIRRIPTREG